MLVVMILFCLTLFMCCTRKKYMANQLAKLNSRIFNAADVILDNEVLDKTFDSKNSFSGKSFHCDDPYEFPRENLLMLDVIGMYYLL